MPQKWRWDQGRLTYFQYENLKAIAHTLRRLEGVEINQKDVDPLRGELESFTGLPLHRIHIEFGEITKEYLSAHFWGRILMTDFTLQTFVKK